MQLNFVKMHGLGNDFMLVEWPADRPLPDAELVRQWSDRRLGVDRCRLGDAPGRPHLRAAGGPGGDGSNAREVAFSHRAHQGVGHMNREDMLARLIAQAAEG